MVTVLAAVEGQAARLVLPTSRRLHDDVRDTATDLLDSPVAFRHRVAVLTAADQAGS
jgi:hypothetical protein